MLGGVPEVQRRTVATLPTAVVAATTTWAEFPELWPRLLSGVHDAVTWGPGVRPGRNVMLYLDGTPRVEVGVLLEGAASVASPAMRSALPAGEVATTVHVGGYDGLGAAHGAVLAWCKEHGLATTGVRWEVYGHWSDDPAEVRTEIAWQLG